MYTYREFEPEPLDADRDVGPGDRVGVGAAGVPSGRSPHDPLSVHVGLGVE